MRRQRRLYVVTVHLSFRLGSWRPSLRSLSSCGRQDTGDLCPRITHITGEAFGRGAKKLTADGP